MTHTKLITFLFLFLPILTIAQMKEKFHNNYDSTKTAFDNITSGFANEFFEYGDKFRIRAKDTGNGNENTMLLEKMENKNWTFVDSFSYSYCFSHSVFCSVKDKDLNKDGVKDFIIEYGKWSTISLVYKYDRTKKNLIRVGFFFRKSTKSNWL